MATDSRITTSWVIRTKNEGKWLGKVLDKLFAQTRKDFEIIIIDSGSTDSTLKIVASYKQIKLIKTAPSAFNFSYALNLGASKAQGKFIGILSGHSIPESNNFYAEIMKYFNNSKVAAVTGHYYALPDAALIEKVGEAFVFPNRFFTRHFCREMTNTNSIIRKELWYEYPFDERLTEGCEDYDWACEMIVRGYDIIKSPKFNVRHSHPAGSGRTYLEMLPIWTKARQQIDLKKRPSQSFSIIIR